MVDKKITALDELTTPADADLLAIVDDVAGTPVTKKVTMANIGSQIDHIAIQNTGTLTHSQLETSLTGVSGATVTNAGEIINVSGAGVTNTDNIVSASGAGVANASDILAVSGASTTHISSDGTDHSHVVTNDAKVTNATHTGDVTGATELTIGADKVHDSMIDWGTGASQVSAVDLIIADAGTIITSTEVEGALQENRTAVDLNTAKDTNVTTNLSLGTGNATTEVVACSDGTDCTLIEADTDNAGLLGADKWDEIVANSVHTADNTQAHSDYLLNSEADTGVGLSLTGDVTGSATAVVRNILIGTSGTPPTASGFSQGTMYVQYTA